MASHVNNDPVPELLVAAISLLDPTYSIAQIPAALISRMQGPLGTIYFWLECHWHTVVAEPNRVTNEAIVVWYADHKGYFRPQSFQFQTSKTTTTATVATHEFCLSIHDTIYKMISLSGRNNYESRGGWNRTFPQGLLDLLRMLLN